MSKGELNHFFCVSPLNPLVFLTPWTRESIPPSRCQNTMKILYVRLIYQEHCMTSFKNVHRCAYFAGSVPMNIYDFWGKRQLILEQLELQVSCNYETTNKDHCVLLDAIKSLLFPDILSLSINLKFHPHFHK